LILSTYILYFLRTMNYEKEILKINDFDGCEDLKPRKEKWLLKHSL